MPGAGDSRRKDFQQLEKGLIQQVDALNLFLNDIYGDKKIIHDGGIPEKLYEGNVISAVLSPTEGIVFFTHKKPLAAENEVIFEFFDLGKNPIFREAFTIGPAAEEEKGFEIMDDCIGCGKCKRDCPQQCISEGTPFAISQEHCLHCGLCFENCPVQAVRMRGEGK